MTSFKQQNCGGGGGRDLIKMVEKEKSMNEADPDGHKKAPIQRKPSPSKVTKELSDYMKPTSRFDASKNKLQVSTTSLTSSSEIKSTNNSDKHISSRNSGLKPVRPSMKKNSGVGLHPTVNLSRDTCSSIAKIARNPEGLGVDEPDRALNHMLCSYKYCSLHGQKKHEVSLPALKCFLSARRQSVKVTNSVKRKEQSSARKNGRNEIYSKQQEGTLQLQSCEERTQDEVEIVDIVKGINWMILGDHDETNRLQESYSVTSFEDYVDNNSEISIEPMEDFGERIQYIEDERHDEAQLETEEGKAGYVDWEEADDVKEDHEIQQNTTFSYANEEESEEQSGVELPNSPEELLEADFKILEVNCEEKHDTAKANVENLGCCENYKHETNYESQQGMRSNCDKDGDISDGLEIEKENVTNSASFISENPLAELTNSPKVRYSSTIKITAENQESGREFNPRPPRFLPLKPEQEVEVVNLKHQTVEERKATEEWMIDYALRKTLRRMAPARKRKVALLVAAFEKVIQQEQCATAL